MADEAENSRTQDKLAAGKADAPSRQLPWSGWFRSSESARMKLLQYLGMSFGWLILMAIWPLFVIPQIDPRCSTSTSFGFLPAAMVVPFLTLLLYAASVATHAVFAFRQQRFAAREGGEVPLFGLDAAFFIPFSLLSLMGLMSVTNWNSSSHCFLMTFAVALPWIATPAVNTRLLAWTS